jgi:hypothetical protein
MIRDNIKKTGVSVCNIFQPEIPGQIPFWNPPDVGKKILFLRKVIQVQVEKLLFLILCQGIAFVAIAFGTGWKKVNRLTSILGRG